jgi:GNAT superfamily N-acetyltransferase
MSMTEYRIKEATQGEVEIAIAWAREEGWNPGIDDAQSYFVADPKGFFIAYVGDEAVATISAVKYSNDFGFIGFYIVKPPYRGRGYGMAIWSHALNYLSGCNIALDGVISQQSNYKKSGFQLAYRQMRYQGVGGGNPPSNATIAPINQLPFKQIEAYHAPFFPANRSLFLEAWIDQPHTKTLALLDQGEVVGFGSIRACHEGYKIAPLFANSFEVAEDLFLALKATVEEGKSIFLDIPQVNEQAIALAKRHQMHLVFETARMYTKGVPTMPLQSIFGVTSFEIG